MKSKPRLLAKGTMAMALVSLTSIATAANLFNYRAITNGGGNRMWVSASCDYKVAGADVSGRETYQSVNDWLARVAELYDGTVVSSGTVTGPISESGVVVQGNAIVKLATTNVGGQYRYQFNTIDEGANFAKFLVAAATDDSMLLNVNAPGGCAS